MTFDFHWIVMDRLQAYKDTIDVSKALNFYEQQLLNRKGKILEIGLNQLQFLPVLMERGLQVEGIIVCNENYESNSSATVYQSELSDFKLPSLYETIIIPFGQFLTIPERMKAIKALKCCYEHLRPGGLIIIDLFLQDEFHLNQNKVEIKNDRNQLFICDSQIVKIDFYDQKAVYLLSVEQWEDGELLLSERRLQPFLWFGIKEFKLVLERIGFTNVKITGDYQQTKRNEEMSESKMFTFEATKKGAGATTF